MSKIIKWKYDMNFFKVLDILVEEEYNGTLISN